MDYIYICVQWVTALLDPETYVKTVASVLLGLLTIFFLYRSVKLLSEVLYFLFLYIFFTGMLFSFMFAIFQKPFVKEIVRTKLIEFMGRTI